MITFSRYSSLFFCITSNIDDAFRLQIIGRKKIFKNIVANKMLNITAPICVPNTYTSAGKPNKFRPDPKLK